MTLFVLDNSVTMRWFFESGSHACADGVLHDLKTPGSAAVVPVLWRYVSAVLARSQRQGVIPAKEFMNFIADLGALPITIDAGSTDRILSDVHRTAVTYGLTSCDAAYYDAAYLESARRRGLPLATLDNDLIAASGQAGVQVF